MVPLATVKLMEEPYIITQVVGEIEKYNPKYGNERICKCGHPYYRHFDTCDDMLPCGCKYCKCWMFEESTNLKYIIKKIVDKK